MTHLTSAIVGAGLVEQTALLTDGRFGGGTQGISVGHISPEAAADGPLAILRDGDVVEIDAEASRLEVDLLRGRDRQRASRTVEHPPPALPDGRAREVRAPRRLGRDRRRSAREMPSPDGARDAVASDGRAPKVAVVSCYFTLFEEQMPHRLPAGSRGDGSRGYADVLAPRLRRRRRRHADVRRRRRRARTRLLREARPGRRRLRAVDGGAAELRRARARRPRCAARRLERPHDRPAAGRAHPGAGDDQLVAGRRRHARQRARSRRRPFATVTASPSDPDGTELARAHACAPRPPHPSLRDASVLRVGTWIPGLPGRRVRPLPSSLGSACAEHAVARRGARRGIRRRRRRPDRAAARRPRRRAAGTIARARQTTRSMRLALALDDLARRRDAVAATVNCHSEVLRWNPRDRDHRVPRRLAPDGRGHPRLLHRTTCRRRSRSCSPGRSPAGRSTASSTRRSARRA